MNQTIMSNADLGNQDEQAGFNRFRFDADHNDLEKNNKLGN